MRLAGVQYVFAWDTNNTAYGTGGRFRRVHTRNDATVVEPLASGNMKEFREFGWW